MENIILFWHQQSVYQQRTTVRWIYDILYSERHYEFVYRYGISVSTDVNEYVPIVVTAVTYPLFKMGPFELHFITVVMLILQFSTCSML